MALQQRRPRGRFDKHAVGPGGSWGWRGWSTSAKGRRIRTTLGGLRGAPTPRPTDPGDHPQPAQPPEDARLPARVPPRSITDGRGWSWGWRGWIMSARGRRMQTTLGGLRGAPTPRPTDPGDHPQPAQPPEDARLPARMLPRSITAAGDRQHSAQIGCKRCTTKEDTEPGRWWWPGALA